MTKKVYKDDFKILIACEESQTVCAAFRQLGYEAYSCDLQECSGSNPEWHIKGCALTEAYSGKYSMMIAHPPCTFISNAGARHLYPKGTLNENRYWKGVEASVFFMKLYNAPITHIVIENPIPSKIFRLPGYQQTIEPFHFGHPFKKKTCLWLKGIPKLTKTNDLGGGQTSKKAHWFNKGGKERQKNRSKTFKGIADAMAQQWGKYISENHLH